MRLTVLARVLLAAPLLLPTTFAVAQEACEDTLQVTRIVLERALTAARRAELDAAQVMAAMQREMARVRAENDALKKALTKEAPKK